MLNSGQFGRPRFINHDWGQKLSPASRSSYQLSRLAQPGHRQGRLRPRQTRSSGSVLEDREPDLSAAGSVSNVFQRNRDVDRMGNHRRRKAFEISQRSKNWNFHFDYLQTIIKVWFNISEKRRSKQNKVITKKTLAKYQREVKN